MHYLCIYAPQNSYTHLLCKFLGEFFLTPLPPRHGWHAPGWPVVLAIANKFTSKVFICVCLAAKAKKDPSVCPSSFYSYSYSNSYSFPALG